MSKTPEQIAKELSEPFPVSSLGWLPAAVAKGKGRALALPYIDSRDVMNRLDMVVGPAGWSDEYQILPSGQVVCKLSVSFGGALVTKSDVGGQSDQENAGDKMKSAFSDALKRVAVKFGIGRYLYAIPEQWTDFDESKKQFTKTPAVPPQFMNEADRLHFQKLADVGKKKEPAPEAVKKEEPSNPPQGDAPAKDIPKSGKALKERLDKANKTNKGILEFVVNCGILYGYPADINKWNADQLRESCEFGKEFARRLKEKVKRITEEQDAEIRKLMASDLDKLHKACRTAQVYAADSLTYDEAVKVIAALKG